ncbi:hypothetical protein Tco_0005123 [Tanacetum coccineum]
MMIIFNSRTACVLWTVLREYGSYEFLQVRCIAVPWVIGVIRATSPETLRLFLVHIGYGDIEPLGYGVSDVKVLALLLFENKDFIIYVTYYNDVDTVPLLPIMSSASSAVTYTSVYTDSAPGRVFWGADEEVSDGGPPRVIVYGYDGLPMQPVAPPSPDYVPGPEHPPSPDYVPGPEHPPSPIEIPYVPEPEYPEYLVPRGYGADSDPEEDLREDSEEEHADYPADGGDGDDEPSDDDSDDDTDDDEEPFEDEEDDEEEEEHPAPADSSVIPVVDLVPSAGDTEAFETDEFCTSPRTTSD